MRDRIRGPLAVALIATGFSIFAAGPSLAAASRASFQTGMSVDYLSRTISWDHGTQLSKLSGALITAREDIMLRPGLSMNFSAGLSLSNFNGLVFENLPVSLRYGAGSVTGLALGAGLRARLASLGDFEIDGEGQFVSSIGFRKTWALAGFAVPGDAKGRPTWALAEVGARFAYLFFGKVVPYLSVSGNCLWGGFKMNEVLGDLTGSENKPVRGKSYVAVALGADVELSKRLSLRGRAGFLPYVGGVDSAISFGFLYTI